MMPLLYLSMGIDKIAPPKVSGGFFYPLVFIIAGVNIINAGNVWVYDVVIHDIPLTPAELFLQKRVDRSSPPPDDLDKDEVCDSENPPIWMCGQH